ncbi:uroporphyrinogen-III synthase [Conservatibacter flavescens]|uniref:Uroporphyrinogen-III synthase n=1 Tax=Conservatibacter flavescens TaxID=28161 RepID=A0A2M8S356_9PAST|nr:uroporphyrinogen-III synthase [Conservatibacter flavescens]PJG85528.1 uroporphyrinogen-III synthase [Conservatibacter flavescens]
MAVLVARPGEQGVNLTERLNKVGVAALHLPFFRIESGTELNLLSQKLCQLKAGDYVVAVSRHAIEFAHQTLTATGFHWRNDLCYFAVGQRTAEHFSALSEQSVSYPYDKETSEGLLALPSMSYNALQDKRVLLLRGNGGRELFSTEVRQRGAQLDIIECYQRQPIEYDNVEQTSMCIRAGISQIVITSGEMLTYLMDFVPKSEHNWLKSCRLITVSERIANMARVAGWDNVIVAKRVDNATLFDAVLAS